MKTTIQTTNGIVPKKPHKTGYRFSKILKHQNSLIQIFKERTNPLLGLTKKEVIAKYYNYDIQQVIQFKKDKIDALWKEIDDTKYYLRKDKLIAIVPVLMASGTTLNDSSISDPISTKKRVLTATTNVYHSCSDINIAHSIRKRYDKIAEGMIEAGEQVEAITEEGIKNKPIMEVVAR